MPYKNVEDERRRGRERWKDPNYRNKFLAKRREMQKRFKEAVYELYGRKCAHCGYSDERALQVDHVFGDGAADRKACGHNGYSLYKKVLANPERYQLLCANCNWIKRVENKEAPQPGNI